MKILVYGAGHIGSLYAALLHSSGQDVSILARGQRLAQISEHGICIEDADSGERLTANVKTVERLEQDDAYNVILVVLPLNRVAEVLPILSQNRRSPFVVFFGNNAGGPGDLVEALGRERVALGFPGAGAVTVEGALRYQIVPAAQQPTTLGELDGSKSDRMESFATALEGAGFPVSICSDMNAWLITHAAEIVPTAQALYMTACDIERFAGTRDALVLMIRAIREGYSAISALGIPITPRSRRIFQWLPEPLLVMISRRLLSGDGAEIKIGHAAAARSEMASLASDLQELVRKSGVDTPAIDRLNRYLDPDAEALAEGSSEIGLHWAALSLVLALFVGLPIAGALWWLLV